MLAPANVDYGRWADNLDVDELAFEDVAAAREDADAEEKMLSCLLAFGVRVVAAEGRSSCNGDGNDHCVTEAPLQFVVFVLTLCASFFCCIGHCGTGVLLQVIVPC